MEGIESFDNSNEDIISKVGNFDELYEKLDQVKELQGSQDVYESSELKSIIDRVRKGELDPTYITRTGGLRKKVEELLGSENSEKSEYQ